ncbi:hypothetical protein DsansV1_C14g0127641 [Dioscorea sansibarensis]
MQAKLLILLEFSLRHGTFFPWIKVMKSLVSRLHDFASMMVMACRIRDPCTTE